MISEPMSFLLPMGEGSLGMRLVCLHLRTPTEATGNLKVSDRAAVARKHEQVLSWQAPGWASHRDLLLAVSKC